MYPSRILSFVHLFREEHISSLAAAGVGGGRDHYLASVSTVHLFSVTSEPFDGIGVSYDFSEPLFCLYELHKNTRTHTHTYKLGTKF